MSAFATASRSILGWVSAAVAVAVIAVSASILAAPGKAYADTASHIEATGEIHVLVDGAGNAAIPNVTLRNTGSVAAYVTGCSAPDELSGWTCDAVGKRIEPGQSVQASWSGQVSADTAAKLGSEAYFAGTLTYSYVDAELKATVAIDNQDPCVGDTVTASLRRSGHLPVVQGEGRRRDRHRRRRATGLHGCRCRRRLHVALQAALLGLDLHRQRLVRCHA